MTEPAKDVRFDLVIAMFRDNAEGIAPVTKNVLAGSIVYQGDIGKHEPNEIHIDTHAKQVSVLFADGKENKLCDMTDQNVAEVERFYADLKANKESQLKADKVDMGFFQADSSGELKGKKSIVTARFM